MIDFWLRTMPGYDAPESVWDNYFRLMYLSDRRRTTSGMARGIRLELLRRSGKA